MLNDSYVEKWARELRETYRFSEDQMQGIKEAALSLAQAAVMDSHVREEVFRETR